MADRTRPLFQPPPPSADQATRGDRWASNKVPANTRKSYTYWRRRYEEDYCPENNVDDCYPMDGTLLRDFIAWLIETGTKPTDTRAAAAYAPSSLDQAIKAMVRAHHEHPSGTMDAPDPALARQAVDGYTRWWLEQGGEQRRVDPLTISQLRTAAVNIDTKLPIGKRDLAILVVGYFTMRRASTLVAWNIPDVRERLSPSGSRRSLVMAVRASKTDQLGHKDDFAVLEHNQLGVDPIHALEDWLGWLRRQEEIATQAVPARRRGKDPAKVTSGPLFRQLTPDGRSLMIHGHAQATEARRGRLSTRAISRVMDRVLGAAGIPAQGDYTAHSLRAGGVSYHRRIGWSDEQICNQGGWSPTSPEWRRYVRDVDRFEET